MKLNFIRKAKISVKITAIYAFIFSFVLLILSATVLYGVKYYLNIQATKQVNDITNIIFPKLTYNADLKDKNLFYDVPANENIYVRIIASEGKLVNQSNKFDYKVTIKKPYNKVCHLEEKDKHFRYKNIELKNKNYGIVFLQVVKNMDSEYNFLIVLFVFMALADLVGIVLSVLLGYITSRRMLKPIENITKTAEDISINNLKERIDTDGPNDELKKLSCTLNNMIDRLQESFKKQNQFVSDASHELRTPIAVIQGYANLLDRWGKDDREALEKSIKAIKLETVNMAELIEKLLFLAKSDNGILKIEKTKFMLKQLIDEVTEETKIVEIKNLTITNDKNVDVKVFADYRLLKQMLRIFIDNSVKFTPEDGKIDISSEVKGNNVKLTVSDNGAGIQESETKKIFDRFYTVDKSRARESSGTGLGLSIAKHIAAMHDGSIEVESKEGIGTKIIVSLKIL